ncbi:MAG: C25 family cysteine peptidase [Candidatus Helarchaeota archaeon]
MTFFSDLYYANCEENKDEINFPISRISVSNEYSLKKIINKTLFYEKQIHDYITKGIPESEEYNWIKKMLLTSDLMVFQSGQKLFQEVMEKVFEYVKDKINTPIILNSQNNEIELIQEINKGAIISYYIGRGERIGWSVNNGLNNSNIKKLQNDQKLQIVLSNCPNAGAIQYEHQKVFIQEILNYPDGGAVCATGFSESIDLDVCREINVDFFKLIFENKLNIIGKILQLSSNVMFDKIASLKDDESTKIEYEIKKKYILTQICNGDPTLRIPFNLPDSESDEPYKNIAPEPEKPGEEKPPREKLFNEWKEKISDSFLKKLYLPSDFLKNVNLISDEAGDFIIITVRNLYEGKKTESIEIPALENSELTYYTEEQINNASREPPVSFEEKVYKYPIAGSDSTSTCPNCGGTGQVECSYCKGLKKVKGTECTHCKGTGTTLCERCKGCGKITTLKILIWKWQPVADSRYYSSFGVDFLNIIPEVSPEGTNFILNIENTTIDDFSGNEDLYNITKSTYQDIKKLADERTQYNGLKIIKIELQRSEADHAPVVKLYCKYKENEFDVYVIGRLDRRYIFKSPDIPKTFKFIFFIIIIIVSVLILLLILHLFHIF